MGHRLASAGAGETRHPDRQHGLLARIGLGGTEHVRLVIEGLRHGEMERLRHPVEGRARQVLVALQRPRTLHLADDAHVAVARAVGHDQRNAVDSTQVVGSAGPRSAPAGHRTRASRIAPGLAIRRMSSAQYFSSTAGSWYDAWSRIAAPAGNETRTCRKPPAAGNTPA